MSNPTAITLRGVRVHNLKSIDVAIPLQRLTVVTGVCGAGKSSLVFDALYAEAQRRYLQSFSAYTRQFLERFEQPDADEIGDLPPAIALRRVPAGSRATVADLADVAEPMRVLFARAGVIVCPSCDRFVIAHRAEDVAAAIDALPAGTRCGIAFSIQARDAGEQPEQWAALREEGYVRIQAAGSLHRLDEGPVPALPTGEQAWVLVDRVEAGKTARERVLESVDAALRRGEGRIGVLTDTQEYAFDRRYVCPGCGREFPAPTPRLFDWNDPLGACPECHGTGVMKKAAPCPACEGRRWNEQALAVRVGGHTIAAWYTMPISNLAITMHLLGLPLLALPDAARVALDQVRARLDALAALGLGDLTLRESAAALDDGGARRIALAAALTSNLVNVLYLIDEPTIGLHPRDLDKLIAAMHRLRDRGNTVVVIEHERAVLAAADHLIDLGPGAGEEGGQVVYQGSLGGLAAAAENPTSDFWTRRSFIETPPRRRAPTGFLKLTTPELTAEFPLGVLCVVTGGGGRRLLEQSLHPALCAAKKKKDVDSVRGTKIAGASSLADVVWLDQTPLARSGRSNPATYLKIFDDIRALFAETVDARIRNFGPGHFSFNQPGGRCETCEGQGTLTIDMQFLADVTTICPECGGRRYRKEILDIKVRSRGVAEVLDLTVREAFRFFRAQPAIEKKLKVLLDVGLDYLRLGQPMETLAGGECQRLKLAGHLASSRKGGCLFLLIEPSAGLHPADVLELLESFDRLLSAGHSIVVVDHDLDVIRSSDYVLEFDAGKIVAQGTPEEIARAGAAPIARYLELAASR